MNRPLISVITTVYNASSTLEATLKSVLSQEKGLFEYWIIDGGSTDSSVDIIRKYENQLAGWVSEQDKGIFDAMNKGVDRATGDWLYFLGADDLLCEGILSKVSSHLQPNLATVYGDVMYDNGHIYHSHIGVRCMLENRLHHQGAFYHRSLFNDFRYNQKFNICADYELTLRIYLQKQPSLFVPYIISIFASGGNSVNLTSNDINNIRGLYLRNAPLNILYSLLINSYYLYVKTKRKIKQNFQKNFN